MKTTRCVRPDEPACPRERDSCRHVTHIKEYR